MGSGRYFNAREIYNMRFLFLLMSLVLFSGCVQEGVVGTTTTLSANQLRDTTSTVLVATSVTTTTLATKPTLEIVNPASSYCIEHAGKLDIVDGADGQMAYCILPGGVECEEWAYFRGECPVPKTTTTAPRTFNCTAIDHPTTADCLRGFCPRTGARCRYVPGSLYKPAECKCI